MFTFFCLMAVFSRFSWFNSSFVRLKDSLSRSDSSDFSRKSFTRVSTWMCLREASSSACLERKDEKLKGTFKRKVCTQHSRKIKNFSLTSCLSEILIKKEAPNGYLCITRGFWLPSNTKSLQIDHFRYNEKFTRKR